MCLRGLLSSLAGCSAAGAGAARKYWLDNECARMPCDNPQARACPLQRQPLQFERTAVVELH